MAKALLIDVSKCTGCRACQVACKQWNDLPSEETTCLGCYDNPPDLSPDTWNRIAFKEIERENGRLDWAFWSVRCLHCTDAPCVRVCPTGALYKHPLGFTAYDASKCNGCGYCTQFCPFGIPRLKGADLWGRGEITKCNFCQDRVTAGLAPACAKACPTGAIEYGERDALISKGKVRVEALNEQGCPNANLYGHDILGGLGVMCVLTDRPSVFDLPEHPTAALAQAWKPWVQTLGEAVLGATVLGVLAAFFVARRNIRMEEVE
jgi:formate dehydrogenase iron-sulfur subunit